MQGRIWIKALMLLGALCLAGLAAQAQQGGSSQQQTGDAVADAARKAREEKKKEQKPKKVYTDDDVNRAAPAAASGATGSGASSTETAPGAQKAANGTQAGKEDKKEDPNSESAWRKRFQAQRDKIAKAERELDILQRELEKAQTQYYSDPQKAMTEQTTRGEVNEKTAKIAAKKQEIAQLKQGLDDLEDQLRKSGGDVGWAR